MSTKAFSFWMTFFVASFLGGVFVKSGLWILSAIAAAVFIIYKLYDGRNGDPWREKLWRKVGSSFKYDENIKRLIINGTWPDVWAVEAMHRKRLQEELNEAKSAYAATQLRYKQERIAKLEAESEQAYQKSLRS